MLPKKMSSMKRYLIPILVAVLVLVSGVTVGCIKSQEPGTTATEDKPSWTEKQVIDYLHEYLVNKAEQLSEHAAKAQKVVIGWAFRNAVFEANREALDEDKLDKLGELVYVQFGESSLEISTWTGALRRLAEYEGSGWWAIFIAGEWRVNEGTKEVVAWTGEAAKLLEEISHATYHSNMYGYHIDYPAGWTLTQIGDEGKILIVGPESQVDITIDKPRKLQPGQSLSEGASGFATFFSTVYKYFELINLVKLENGDYQMDYKWIVGETNIQSRTYFVLHKGWFYMISGSAPKSTYDSYLGEFDYAYNSFGFN